MFAVSSRILILSIVCILVAGQDESQYCYLCSSVNKRNSYCNTPGLIIYDYCKSYVCGKRVSIEFGFQARLRRFCATVDDDIGCFKSNETASDFYIENCFCDSSYCNKADNFTWSLFVNLPLVVCSLFGMF